MNRFEASLGHVINLDFDTHESMIDAALHWSLEEYQLDSGRFKGTINAVHTLNIQIASTFRSSGVFVKGNIPKNTYLFASAESKGKITHNGLSINENELIVLNENDQLDFTSSSAVNDVTIAIDKDFFDDAFKNYFNKHFQYDTINKRIQLKEDAGSTFRASVQDLVGDLMKQNTKLQSDSVFCTKTEQEILQIIFDNIDHSRQHKSKSESEINAEKIRKYIEKNYMSDIYINNLCNNKKISERTLRLAFKKLFGMSPKQYHKSYRLGKIHHTFLQNSNTIETVENIAYAHGFTHMGHFAKSYKSMFGYTPSHTLKKLSP
ncbi:helix-turn-helix domain-containing protein [Sulfurovum sp.]|uniref:helix-turn-helix domain-containing protein n=1 Tax=Sulfurovum sp. TaxID=1969726 RepID=UPI0035659978